MSLGVVWYCFSCLCAATSSTELPGMDFTAALPKMSRARANTTARALWIQRCLTNLSAPELSPLGCSEPSSAASAGVKSSDNLQADGWLLNVLGISNSWGCSMDEEEVGGCTQGRRAQGSHPGPRGAWKPSCTMGYGVGGRGCIPHGFTHCGIKAQERTSSGGSEEETRTVHMPLTC